jgi:hypothetical protein
LGRQPRQHTLKMGTELLPETSESLHILTLLSARKNFIECCRRESFKTDKNILPTDTLLRMSAYKFKIELFRGKF